MAADLVDLPGAPKHTGKVQEPFRDVRFSPVGTGVTQSLDARDHLLWLSPDGLVVLSETNEVLFCNPSAAEMLGDAPDALVGGEFMVGIGPGEERELPLPAGNWVELRAVAADWEGSPALLVALRDTTKRRRAQERLVHLAHHDQLTGLANRTLFRERLNHSLVRASRKKSCFALLAFDLDRFKEVNDHFGHDAGDRLLVEVVSRLRGVTRETDTLARLGGDEFALIVEDIGDPGLAPTIAKKAIQALHAPFLIDGTRVSVTTSVGIATYPQDAEDAEELLVDADSAMYRAKKSGRDTYCCFEESTLQVALERVRKVNDLRSALRNDEFDVYYQPVFNADEMVGMESLLRWNHPARGLVLPSEFVPLLESTGQIVEVGTWLLRVACAQMQKWRETGAPGLRISINVSPRQLLADGFVETVTEALAETRLPGMALELEITESMLMTEDDRTIHTLESLHAAGVRIALDDFGTGYSSLAHLSRLPAIASVKIDRSFVSRICTDSRDEAIVRAIIGLGHSLGLDVVAEGVEHPEQHQFLKVHGCSSFQGFLLGRPQRAAAWAF